MQRYVWVAVPHSTSDLVDACLIFNKHLCIDWILMNSHIFVRSREFPLKAVSLLSDSDLKSARLAPLTHFIQKKYHRA